MQKAIFGINSCTKNSATCEQNVWFQSPNTGL